MLTEENCDGYAGFLARQDIRAHIASETGSLLLLANINRSWFDPVHGKHCDSSVSLGRGKEYIKKDSYKIALKGKRFEDRKSH